MAGPAPDPASGAPSVPDTAAAPSALVERYLRFRATRLSRSTVAAYRADLLHFTASLSGRSLLSATADDVAAWFHANTRTEDDPDDGRPWSARTAHRRRASLHRFYQWALKQELVRRNPVEAIELPRFHRRPPCLVAAADIERIFTYLEEQIQRGDVRRAKRCILDAAIFRLMERLALRVSEAAGIRLSRLSTADNELRAWVAKKGNKPKIYPIVGVVRGAFVRWLEVRAHIQAIPGHEDFVFVDPATGRRVTRQRVWSRLRQTACGAGLEATTIRALTPHKLRHARARAMLHAGWDIAAVQSVLDHASIQTTQVYVEDSEEARLRALRAVSDASLSEGLSGVRISAP